MTPSLFMRLLLLVFAYNALVLYIGWNGLVWLTTAISPPPLFAYWLFVFFCAYAYVLARFIKLTAFKVAGAYWFFVVQYCLLLLPVSNVIIFTLSYTSYDLDQLIIWTGLLVISTFLVILIYGTFNAYSPIVRSYHITVPKRANKYDKLRIAVASDMHFGNLSGTSHLRRLNDKINQIKPDLILLPGDIIDDDPRPFIAKKMSTMMKEMDAPLGIYGVLGNHEYYGRAIPLFIDEMSKNEMTILMDEVVLINDSFYIVGRKDKTDQNRSSIEDLVKNIDHSLPIILMDHQPFELQQAMMNNIDISLSGHTHRGQMAPNHLITRKIYELDWGYKKKQQLHAFVSSGFGFWGPPIRIGSRSEIIQIDITFETRED